ncbi:uncharacterized protein [Macrobrachium rosenbergii]|uniref:uncharacterized protein n=1 Tax=Macrobrachium rosenbergii TaxID=79674 RepID=UPI0034D4F4AC
MSFSMKIVLIWMVFGYLNSTKAFRYACPSNAWCVPSENCNDGSVVHAYNATDSSRLVEYVCGVISTEDYVCCAETGLFNISTDYTPSRTNWFYPKENVTVIRGLVVLPWPGHEATEVTVPDLKKPPPICPSYSVCVPPAVCPGASIRYSGALMGDIINFQYQCGHTWDTVSWTCCSVHIFINAIYEALNNAPVVAPRFAPGNINVEVIKHSPRIFDYSKTLGSLSGPRLATYSQTRKRREITASDLTDDAELENGIEVNDTIIVVSAALPFESAPENGTEFSGRSAEGTSSQSIPRPGVPSSCGKPIGQGIAAHQSTPYNADLTNAGLTREGQYPWHVALLTVNREYLCGGTIVADRHVITVAHCVDAYTAQALRVRVGDYDLTSNTESQPSYDVELTSIVFHPNYTKPTLKSDLAVLVLKFSVLSLPNVARVCFPGEGAASDKQECYVPGWGSVTPARQGSPRITNFHPVLKDSGLVLVGSDRCEQQLRKVKSLGVFFKLLPGVTCVKGLHQRDSCHGDGGSGLVCRTVAGEFVLQGLISWSAGCDRGLPTALVDVGFYADFILNVIRGVPFLGSTSFSDGTSSNNSRFGFNFQGASSQSSVYGTFQHSSFNSAQSSFGSAYQSSFSGSQQVSGSTQQSGALFGQYSSGNVQQTGNYAASSSSSTGQTEQSYQGGYASTSQGINTNINTNQNTNTYGGAQGSTSGVLRGPLMEALRGPLMEALRGPLMEALRGPLMGALRGPLMGALRGHLWSTQGATYGSTQGATYGSTQGATYGSTQGATYGSTQGATYGSTQGANFGSTQGVVYGSTQGAILEAPRGHFMELLRGCVWELPSGGHYGNAQGPPYGNAQGPPMECSGATYGNVQGPPMELLKELRMELLTELLMELLKELRMELLKELLTELVKELLTELLKELLMELVKELLMEVLKELFMEALREQFMEALKELLTAALKGPVMEVLKEEFTGALMAKLNIVVDRTMDRTTQVKGMATKTSLIQDTIEVVLTRDMQLGESMVIKILSRVTEVCIILRNMKTLVDIDQKANLKMSMTHKSSWINIITKNLNTKLISRETFMMVFQVLMMGTPMVITKVDTMRHILILLKNTLGSMIKISTMGTDIKDTMTLVMITSSTLVMVMATSLTTAMAMMTS